MPIQEKTSFGKKQAHEPTKEEKIIDEFAGIHSKNQSVKTSGPQTSQSSANPNGYLPIVFTYGGQAFNYQSFLDTFFVTLPGGAGVQLGPDQYYGYKGTDSSSILTLGTSYALNNAASSIESLLPTNGSSNELQQAFKTWAASQAASPGQTSYANLYLNFYTGGRVYLSNGDLGLGSSGEPSPASPNDPAYNLVYDLFEPYIGAQVGSSTTPGNNGDITDIDWFSFPITLKVWSYDFTNNPATLSCGESQILEGGDGSAIWQSLLIAGSGPTNQYPSKSFPAQNNSTAACRLIAPTQAAGSEYYSDPATSFFPYSYFDAYLNFLRQAQSGNSSLFTLQGTYGGSNEGGVQYQQQTFSFDIDFSGIETSPYIYPSGVHQQIKPASHVVLRGYTALLGSSGSPFQILLPWAKGGTNFALKCNPTPSPANDALAQGWLSITGAPPAAPSATYSALDVTAADSSGRKLTPVSGLAQMQLIFSVNSNPLSGTLDDLYQSGNGKWLTLTNTAGLTFSQKQSVYTQALAGGAAVLIITTNNDGSLDKIQINDMGCTPQSSLSEGAQWVIPAEATGLGNNQSFTVTLAQMPLLRNAFMLSGATYSSQPTTVTVDPTGSVACTLQVNNQGLTSAFAPSPHWTTLSQPAGIYGANAGYVISGLTGENADLNGNVYSLQNDVFGWIVADLLAALNAGLVASPAPWNGKTVGNSPNQWFVAGNNPYTARQWGAAGWETVNPPITNFWDTWAWELYGQTDAYNFSFKDRFEANVLLAFNPPPPNPSSLQPVLLEVVVGDSPVFGVVKKLQANQPWFDTGIDVGVDGKTIQYVSGLWTADPQTNGGQSYDANGCPGLTVTQPAYPLTGVNMGALVGKVGDNPVFLVGDGPTSTPSGQLGRLYLCINDDLNHVYGAGLADNSGSITVKVS